MKITETITTTGITLTVTKGGTILERFYIRPVDDTVTDQIFGVTSNKGVDTVTNGLDFKTISKAIAYVKTFAKHSREY